jgi:hypothetical protein
MQKSRDLHFDKIICNNSTQRIPHKAMPILHDKTRKGLSFSQPIEDPFNQWIFDGDKQ